MCVCLLVCLFGCLYVCFCLFVGVIGCLLVGPVSRVPLVARLVLLVSLVRALLSDPRGDSFFWCLRPFCLFLDRLNYLVVLFVCCLFVCLVDYSRLDWATSCSWLFIILSLRRLVLLVDACCWWSLVQLLLVVVVVVDLGVALCLCVCLFVCLFVWLFVCLLVEVAVDLVVALTLRFPLEASFNCAMPFCLCLKHLKKQVLRLDRAT